MESNNRIIIFSGPQKGMGKTIISTNLAIDWAMRSRKQVVLIDLDPLCKGEIAGMLGVSAHYISEMSIVMQRDTLDGEFLRGRIGFNKWGVGVLALAPDEKTAAELSLGQITRTLIGLSRIYSLVIDMDSDITRKGMLIFDFADVVFWIFLPSNVFLKQTMDKMKLLASYKFSFSKFCFILNQSNIKGAIKSAEINAALNSFGKKIEEFIPQDKLVPQSDKKKIPLVVNEPHTIFSESIRRIRGIMLNLPPRGRKIEEVSVLEGLLDKFDLVIKKEKKQSKDFVVSNLSPEELLIKEEEEKKRTALKQKIHQQLIKRLDVRKIDLISSAKNQQVKIIVEKTATFILSTEIDVDSMSRQEREELIAEIVDEALGLGPLEALMSEPSITEIMVNKCDQIYIEQDGRLQLTDRKFINNDQVIQVIRKIVAPLGRRIDESMPFVDARLKDGSRINAIIPPLALQGPMLTIRRFPQDPLTGEDLVEIGTFSKEMLQFLSACIKIRKNVLVSGGTGTGKTTMLNILSASIPEKERIITIEDTAELKLKQEHVGRLESRPSNVEGKGAVSIRDLVRNTLRMRPDRIIVGECRGAEALDMLQAMNTGHEGSMSTIHANTPRDMLSRLETMILMSGTELPLRAIREQIASAIHIVVQLSRFSDGTRKVVKITEVTGREKDVITVQDIFIFHRTEIKDKKIMGYFQPTGNVPRCYYEFRTQGINLPVEIFRVKKNEKALNP